MFASSFFVNRASFDQLPNTNPKQDIRKVPLGTYSLNPAEWKVFRHTTKILIGRILVEFLPCMEFLKDVIPNHVKHEYSGLMALKSTIISMPIIDANEQNYEDCVKILRTYEKWIGEFR